MEGQPSSKNGEESLPAYPGLVSTNRDGKHLFTDVTTRISLIVGRVLGSNIYSLAQANLIEMLACHLDLICVQGY